MGVNKLKFITAIIIVFLIGLGMGVLSSNNGDFSLEKPLTSIRLYAAGIAPEKHSPQNWISEDNIHVYDNRVVIDIENPKWAKFTDTNSMDPAIDIGSNTIRIMPDDVEKIAVGDIISYESEKFGGIIIHRVVETGHDEEGWYAIAKGDNMPATDPVKVRKENVKGVAVAIIY